MNFFSDQIDLALDFIKSAFKRYYIFTGALFFSSIIFGFIIPIFFRETADEMMRQLIESFEQSGILSDEGMAMAINLLANNAKACFLTILYGIVPFIFFPLLTGMANGAILSIVLYTGSNGDILHLSKMFLFGILPHGIFEFPALILSIACGVYLCKSITLGLFRNTSDLKVTFENIVRVYFIIIIPCLVLAALIEAFITPLLINVGV